MASHGNGVHLRRTGGLMSRFLAWVADLFDRFMEWLHR